MSACKSCGARIIWAKTIHGKRIPLDADPDPSGNVTLDERGRAHVHGNVSRQVSLNVDPVPRYMPHWATCPSADEHRKASAL